MRIKTHLGVLLALSFLAILIYSNTFSVPFFFDDKQNIVDNPIIKHLGNFFDLSSSRYVGFLSFALNYHFGGLDVFGYHLVNLLIHITNGFLVYVLVVLLFETSESFSEYSYARPIAIATALLFIAHPVQTQAVTYIVQRFASLAALFYLLGVVGYLKWRLSNRWGWYAAALTATILGMKTKEFVFTLPFMILLIETLFFSKKRWVTLIPFFLTLFIIPLSRFDVLSGENAPLFSGTDIMSRSEYLFTQLRVIVTYIRLLFWPTHQTLDYDYLIYQSLFDAPVLGSFLLLLSIFAMAIFLLRSKRDPQFQLRLIAFGIFWFFLTITPESSIIPIRDVIFEHRLYLPSVGVFLSVCVAFGLIVGRIKSAGIRKLVGFLSMGVLVLIFSVATYQRNGVWKDDKTLWGDVVQKSPLGARGYNNLGLAYYAEGRLEDAVEVFKIATQLQPMYAHAHSNLGNAYLDLGRPEEGLAEYLIALQLQPDYADAHVNLAVAYSTLGRFEEAVRESQIALKLRPTFIEAHYNMGLAYWNNGKLEEARQEFEAALKIKPDWAPAREALDELKRLP